MDSIYMNYVKILNNLVSCQFLSWIFGYINVNLIYFIFYCIFKVLQFLIEALIMLERNNRPKMESLVFSPTSANQDLMPNIIAVSYFSRNVTFT